MIDQDYKVIGSSAENQEIVGTRFTDQMVRTAFNQGAAQKDIRIAASNAERILLWSEPLMTEDGVVIGNLYLITKIENVYKELEQINTIMARATIISLLVTAVLGILLAQTRRKPSAPSFSQWAITLSSSVMMYLMNSGSILFTVGRVSKFHQLL